jgi:hypothetical protein
MEKVGYILPQQDSCIEGYRDSLDQQLLRLTSCSGDGGGFASPIRTDIENSSLYELPQGLPVNAPLDATKIEPGIPTTEQPAPAPVPVVQTTAVNTVTQSGVMQWVKDNPMIAGGAALVLLYFLTRKKR